MVEDWAVELLERARPDAAWDLFLQRYRRLIFASIRHYSHDHDAVMDIFASVCGALREGDLRRLRSYAEQPRHRARFSTWLVTVVRHLAVDWFRHRDGRRRLSTAADGLSPLQRRIFEYVFLDQRSHVEAYELILTGDDQTLSFGRFLAELRATYRTVTRGRRGGILREFAGPLADAEPDPLNPTDLAERRELLENALATLSPGDRVAVELYVLEEVPAEDVARMLGYPNAKTVYNRVYRALAAIRGRLEGAGLHRQDL